MKECRKYVLYPKVPSDRWPLLPAVFVRSEVEIYRKSSPLSNTVVSNLMLSMNRIEVILDHVEVIELLGHHVDGRNRESGFLYFETGETV
jgi:hypothetical protein